MKSHQTLTTNTIKPKTTMLAVVMAIAVLTGCAVGPDYRSPVLTDIPTQWGQASADTTITQLKLTRWWDNFNDPVLTGLINQAVAGNLSVATAKAKIREARASYEQSTGRFLPSLTLSAGATRSNSTNATLNSVNNQFRSGFDASWEIDLFGANRRNAEAAEYGLDAAEEELRSTLLTLIGDVASGYIDLRGYQARLVFAKSTAQSQRTNADLTRTRYEAGAVSAVDMANAEGQASNSEATIPSLQTNYLATLHRLSILTGQPPTALQQSLDVLAPVPVPRLPVATGVPADILLTRPDVRLAERKLAQATARIGQAEAARYPSVSLTGSISTSALQFGDLAKNSTIVWSFGPSISIPLFKGGQLAAAVDVARAQRDQNFIAYQSSVLTALEDVENALVALTQEQVRNQKLTVAVQNYRKSTELSRALYQIGATSFLDVLTAERSLYSAEDPLIQSNATIAKNYIALNKALGGGWSDPVDVTSPRVEDTSNGPRLISTTSNTSAQQ
jgi:multidrug efflux system outer membrane protein